MGNGYLEAGFKSQTTIPAGYFCVAPTYEASSSPMDFTTVDIVFTKGDGAEGVLYDLTQYAPNPEKGSNWTTFHL